MTGSRWKHLAIALDLYPAARGLHRLLHRQARLAFQRDVAFYRDLIPPGALCFDVGANVGSKSEALLRAGARVVSFEPHPDLWSELRARCRSPDWMLVPAAMGAAPAFSTFYIKAISGNSSLDQSWKGQKVAAFSVPVFTLDLAIAEYGVPYYCKIDVEGWEVPVINGLSHCLPMLSFEYHLATPDAARACLERLRTLGSTDVNVTGAEEAAFRWPEWRPIETVIASLGGDGAGELPDDYGDIYVRSGQTREVVSS